MRSELAGGRVICSVDGMSYVAEIDAENFIAVGVLGSEACHYFDGLLDLEAYIRLLEEVREALKERGLQ